MTELRDELEQQFSGANPVEIGAPAEPFEQWAARALANGESSQAIEMVRVMDEFPYFSEPGNLSWAARAAAVYVDNSPEYIKRHVNPDDPRSVLKFFEREGREADSRLAQKDAEDQMIMDRLDKLGEIAKTAAALNASIDKRRQSERQ